MSGCDALVQEASAGVAASLRAVDCVSAEATTSAFTRLFGTQGALLPALTILLTLYVGFFALMLLTGRSRLSVGTLTPRMIMLGLVLTFTTSSVAYQGVVWNLTVGAPDQIAGILMGAKGSATQLFANRIDIILNAIAQTASEATQGAAARPASPGSFTPSNVMWMGSLLLLLGTVGVLLTARIALAVLLALGPVFITLVLFQGTRGLFAGWLRAVALTALTPLLAVLCGALMTELAVPVVASLGGTEGIDGRAAIALFVIAAVHCALMALALRVASTLVAGWRVFGLSGSETSQRASESASTIAPAPAAPVSPATTTATPRARALAASLSISGGPGAAEAAPAVIHRSRSVIIPAASPTAANRPAERLRTRGIGSRFSTPATSARKRFQ